MISAKPFLWFVAPPALGLALLAGLWYAPGLNVASAANEGNSAAMLAHNVYFSLHDSSPEARRKLVDACHKYLADHPGTVFYACGTVADLDRDVNDRDWDVGLHIVFQDRAAHDQYQSAPLHLKFIEENKAAWKKVRVFDSDVSGK